VEKSLSAIPQLKCYFSELHNPTIMRLEVLALDREVKDSFFFNLHSSEFSLSVVQQSYRQLKPSTFEMYDTAHKNSIIHRVKNFDHE
jgi:hypothetical protein